MGLNSSFYTYSNVNEYNHILNQSREICTDTIKLVEV